MKAWSIKELEGRQVLRMEFDRSAIKADAVLNNDRLRIRFANSKAADSVSKQLATTENSPVQQLELRPGDLALQESARILFALDARPSEKVLRAMAADWSPWRAVAARLLWAYYRVAKDREGIR